MSDHPELYETKTRHKWRVDYSDQMERCNQCRIERLPMPQHRGLYIYRRAGLVFSDREIPDRYFKTAGGCGKEGKELPFIEGRTRWLEAYDLWRRR